MLPIDEWETVLERLETLKGIAVAKAAMSEETLPAAFVDRLLAGEALAMRGQNAAIDLSQRQALAQVRPRSQYRHLLSGSGSCS